MPTQAPTQALRVKVQRQRDQQRRHDQRRPDAIVRGEHDARGGGARDQHQQARVGHVVPEHALRPPAEVVELEDRVLDDAEHRR